MAIDNVFFIAFLLTLIAGLSTGIGSTIAFFAKKTNTRFLSFALGLSAGVMLYISFVELFPEARHNLTAQYGDLIGISITVVAFFLGIGVIAVIDLFVPELHNPHRIMKVEDMDNKKKAKNYKGLYSVGILVAISIAIHNFPEGIATFASSMQSLKLGVPIALAVAIHNIPEGIAVSIPIYYSTGSKKKAFYYSLLSGLSEPLGAIIGSIVLFSFFPTIAISVMLAFVAGIMVFISLDQLLPTAREYGEHHYSIFGLVVGMGIMAISLILFI